MPQFGIGLTQRTWYWAAFKNIAAIKKFSIQYETSEDGSLYTIWGYDHPEVHVCTIWKGELPAILTEENRYSQEQNDADKAEFESRYVSRCNGPVSPSTSDGRVRVAIEKSDASKKNFFSHDWTDKTTWSTNSIRVANEVATDSGNHTTYTLAHAWLVDLYHGKVFNEDYLRDAGNYSYRVAVKVNGTTKTEQDPHIGAGGDFTVNYPAGSITFLSALQGTEEVTVTYHYVTDSTYVIKPDPGKSLLITFAEIQLSTDVVLTDSAVFQPYGLVDVFAPQLVPNVLPSGTLIPLGNPVVYKSIRDYQSEAVKAFPVYPALGGNGWRGISQEVVVLDWDYISSTALRSDYGMEVRVKLQHDVPFEGTYATCSFYCTNGTLLG